MAQRWPGDATGDAGRDVYTYTQPEVDLVDLLDVCLGEERVVEFERCLEGFVIVLRVEERSVLAQAGRTRESRTSLDFRNCTVSSVFWISGILSLRPSARFCVLCSMNWYFLYLLVSRSSLLTELTAARVRHTRSSRRSSAMFSRHLRGSSHSLQHAQRKAHRECLGRWLRRPCCFVFSNVFNLI